MTEGQRKGLPDPIEEIDAGKGIPHAGVMEKIRGKFRNV